MAALKTKQDNLHKYQNPYKKVNINDLSLLKMKVIKCHLIHYHRRKLILAPLCSS